MELHFAKSSRAKIVAYVMIAVFGLFIVRLFYIQIVQHGHYVAEADNEQIKQFVLHAERGEIYAMDGDQPVKLVLNQTVYTVWADPTMVTDKQAVVDALEATAPDNVRDNFAKYLDVKDSRYQVLATGVTFDQAKALKGRNLAGLGFDATSRRVYPEGQLASQVLGFVNAEGQGVYGIEQAENSELEGKDGVLKTVTDIRDVPLTIGDKNVKKPAVDGQNIVLTIDRNIQSETEQALADGIKRSGATDASAIVMDPTTGEVLAMANVPTYDPSHLNQVSDVALFNNNVISLPYEAGSDIKTFTVATGVDKGVITPDTKWDNTGQTQVADITINNATLRDFLTGNITMQTALNWSLNTGMVQVARLLGDGQTITRQARDTIYDYFYNHFRLGQKTGIQLANEQSGVIISPAEEQGNAVRYSNMVFGQGMDVTMMQVASGFSALVDGGVWRQPTIIKGSIDSNGNFQAAAKLPTKSGVIKASTSATMREMIHEAHYATYAPHNEPTGYFIGGKTGTSQTIINGKYADNQTIGTYLGFGGEVGQMPRYVIMVEISGKGEEMGGGTDAKPIFNDISNYLIDYLKLSPNN